MNYRLSLLVVSIIVVVIIAAATTDSGYNVLAKNYKKSETTAQVNDCGNGILPLNIDCQNTASQTQGNDNTVSTSSSIPFP
jgi:hypothetical protein